MATATKTSVINHLGLCRFTMEDQTGTGNPGVKEREELTKVEDTVVSDSSVQEGVMYSGIDNPAFAGTTEEEIDNAEDKRALDTATDTVVIVKDNDGQETEAIVTYKAVQIEESSSGKIEAISDTR